MEVPRHWRLEHSRYGLIGEVCLECNAKIFPPRDICPHCSRTAKTPFPFSGRGEIYSHTTMYEAPEGFDKNTPYTVALVKLEEGPLVTAQLTDIQRVYEDKVLVGIATIMRGILVCLGIGSPVKMVTRILREDGQDGKGIIVYGYKFIPDEPAMLQRAREKRAREGILRVISA